MDILLKNIIASSSTISLSVMMFNPLDCLRIRWQVSKNNNFRNYTYSIIKKEGIMNGLWKPGIIPNTLGAGISRGIGMGFYPVIRDHINKEKTFLTMFISGLISGSIGYMVSNPFWLIKTRMQGDKEFNKFNYKTTLLALKNIHKYNGLRGLYKGSYLLAIRGALMNSGNTLGYDGTKTILKKNNIKDSPYLHIISSINAAFLSVTLSTPIDYIITKYQTSTVKIQKQKIIYIFRGWLPMFIRVAPIYCLYLPFYEQVRKILGLKYL